ncbi:hypothetical protein F5Y11DRAFT_342759 [Daldinia sp. FL1419]|nr:hypothetical protein F5Y11DRAFT_342759 [Daldinia sp. FL1419]
MCACFTLLCTLYYAMYVSQIHICQPRTPRCVPFYFAYSIQLIMYTYSVLVPRKSS